MDAEFLGLSNGKLRLHKTNGVVIEVPTEKMSQEDLNYVGRSQGGNGKSPSRALSPGSDDEPLAVRRRSLQPETKKPAPPKKKDVDWFEFFLNAGCDLDDCTRYANSFERDKIDESILPDITEQTMRSLGLREGDIIRVTKLIAQRTQLQGGGKTATEEQMKKDEELARKLQEEESRNTPSRQATSPGLFAGPGGILKNNTRRGRPQPSKSTLPATVDLQSIASASQHINRVDSPMAMRVTSPVSVTGPPRAASAAPIVSGFDDDAWTNRPSSTQPPTGNARAPSAPPTQTQAPVASPPPPVPPIPPAAPAPPAPQMTSTTAPTSATSTGPSLARTTEADVFEQLARLSALKTQSSAARSPPAAPASAPVSAISPPTITSPPIITPPMGFQSGMGMGSSPAPMGQLQSHITGFQPQQQQTQSPLQQSVPRGPFAPVPGNQGLLNPLIPTTTGFNSFVPTRPASNPPSFGATSPQPPSFLNTQPTGMPGTLGIQPTGFAGGSGLTGALNATQPTGFASGIGMQAQPTGLPSTGPLMSQTTSYPGALGAGPFSGGRAFGPLQPSMFSCIFSSYSQADWFLVCSVLDVTGFNPSFGQAPSPLSVPPVPPLPPMATNSNANANSTAPANVFAQMKSGTFAQDNAPQPSSKSIHVPSF